MEQVPTYVSIFFGVTTLLTVAFFYLAANRSMLVLLILLLWLGIQAVVSSLGFYTLTNSFPPRFVLLTFPPLLTIIILFIMRGGRKFLDSLDPSILTLLHIVRIPVEIVLYWLFIYRTLPQLMTFQGRNWDIFSGITAPLVWYFGFVKNKLGKGVLIAWNFICLILLFNIVANAILSAPFPFQQFAFDQPNIAVLYFPFVWLPCCVVPLVLLSHLVCIRKLLRRGSGE